MEGPVAPREQILMPREPSPGQWSITQRTREMEKAMMVVEADVLWSGG